MSNEFSLQKAQSDAYWDLYNSYKTLKNALQLQTFKYGNLSKVNDLTHLNRKVEQHRKKTVAFRNATYDLRIAGYDDCPSVKKRPAGFDPSEIMPNWFFKYRGADYYFDEVPQHKDWGGWYQLLYNFGKPFEEKFMVKPELCGYDDTQIVKMFAERAETDVNFEGTVSVDLETTSLSPTTGEIIEIGIVYWPVGVKDINDVERFSMRFDLENPEVRELVGTGPTHIHGIEPKDIMGLPKFSDKRVQKILKHYLCSGKRLLIHNASFEFKWLTTYLDGFYEANVDNHGMMDTVFDSLLMTKGLIEGTPDNKLETLVKVSGFEYKFAHSALADAMMTLLASHEVRNYIRVHGRRFTGQAKPSLVIEDYESLLTVEKIPDFVTKNLHGLYG